MKKNDKKIISETHFIIVNNEKLYFILQRKNIKNINLRVNRDREVIISIPLKMPIDKVEDFIRDKFNWIKRQQDFFDKLEIKEETLDFNDEDVIYILGKQYKLKIVKSKNNKIEFDDDYLKIYIKENYILNKKYILKVYEQWLKETEINIIRNFVDKYKIILMKYKIPFPKIEIRKMKRRWGCCFPYKNKVVFNLSLVKTPSICIEYVVLHELAHFIYHNHSKNFYNFVAEFMPDWKERKKILDRNFV